MQLPLPPTWLEEEWILSWVVNLPKIRMEARRLIVAQAVAGGEPAQEMTARVVED